MRSSLNIVAISLLTASPVWGVSEQLLNLMDELQCVQPDALCGPISVNCTFTGSRGSTWLEITNESNMTQYASMTANVTASDLPDPLPPPYSLSAQDTAAPANGGTCFSRSPGVSADCTENCLYTPYIFDIQWMMFGELVCSGLYPKGGTSGLSNPVPPPGSVNVIATKQCKDYLYVPPWMAVVTDEWGSKWALQTSQEPMADDAAWAANLDAVVWPDGWTYENVTLTSNQTQVSYLMGDTCWSFLIKDSQANTWHMFEYPADVGSSIFASIDCVPLALTTAAGVESEIEGPASEPTVSPSPTSTASEPASTSAAVEMIGRVGATMLFSLMGMAVL
jgi:hypothetical protein